MSDQLVKVGNYILLEKLASGGMAEVYLAKTAPNTGFNKFVAIKKILPHYAQDSEFLNLFKDEIKVSLNLNQGNIVTFIDFLFEGGQLYLVMEYVNGLNLRQIVNDLKFKKMQFELPLVLHIISQVATGLDYAHRCTDAISNQKLNIIHRDINPSNIMVTFDGQIKIIDFGIAKADSKLDVTQVGAIKGKFSYMSPEQAEARPVDARTDLFALGVVFWELLTGRRLFEKNNDYETLTRLKQEPIQAPRKVNAKVPAAIESIVMKVLQKDPAQRYQTAAQLKHEIDEYLWTHHPKFRPNQFAKFIEKIYAELIQSKSATLLNYTKMKFVTEVKIANSIQMEPSQSKELPEGLESASALQVKEALNFSALKSANPFAADVKIQQKQKAGQFFSSADRFQEELKKSEAQQPIFNIPILSNFKHLAMMIVTIYAGYSLYRQFSKAPLLSSFAAPGEVSTEQAAAESYRKLASAVQAGSVDIDVENASSPDVKIFIDGQQLKEKFPISEHVVKTNQWLKISAYDVKKNTYDEKKVFVKSGQTLKVLLRLRPYKR